MQKLSLRAVRRALAVSCAASVLIAVGTAATLAEVFPQRPVKIIVQTAAGSSIDVAARILAENLSRKWGQQAYVVNQPGAGGAIATRAAASAPPNGETLLFAASSIFVALPVMHPEEAASVDKFLPVAFVGEQPMAVAVRASDPARTFPELLAAMRNTGGGLNCAVSTRGGLSHMSGEMLKDAVGAKMTFVHYPGTAQALSDVIGGRVPMVIDSMSAFIGPAAGGQVRILGVASAERLTKILPDVPTISETLPGFEAIAWLALVAPAGTPAPVVARIKSDVDAILSDAAVSKRLQDLGTLTHPMSQTELAAFIKAQRAKWLPIVQRYGSAK